LLLLLLLLAGLPLLFDQTLQQQQQLELQLEVPMQLPLLLYGWLLVPWVLLMLAWT
jgi:hypothetical protein